jgi:hypothetical protein
MFAAVALPCWTFFAKLLLVVVGFGTRQTLASYLSMHTALDTAPSAAVARPDRATLSLPELRGTVGAWPTTKRSAWSDRRSSPVATYVGDHPDAAHSRRHAHLSVAPPEYVILRTLEYYREGGSEKHVRDIRATLALSPVPLDRTALADWLGRRGLDAQRRIVTDTMQERSG